MGEEPPKQYALLGGKPLLAHSLGVFERCPLVEGIILVVAQSMEGYCRRGIVEKYDFHKVVRVVPGGETRQDSVYCGLRAIPREVEIVAVHDAVRPFLSLRLLEECIKGAARWGAVAPAIPVADTIKTVDQEDIPSGTMDRQSLRAIQTPQVFRYQTLLRAMDNAKSDGFRGTDETTIVERAGYRVKLLEGSPLNIKVTTPRDMALAEAILKLSHYEEP